MRVDELTLEVDVLMDINNGEEFFLTDNQVKLDDKLGYGRVPFNSEVYPTTLTEVRDGGEEGWDAFYKQVSRAYLDPWRDSVDFSKVKRYAEAKKKMVLVGEIEQGIELPPRYTGLLTHPTIAKMEVGDCVILKMDKGETKEQVGKKIQTLYNAKNKKFRVRQIESTRGKLKWRVWRVE